MSHKRSEGLRIFPVDPAKLGEHYDVPEPTPEFQFERLYEAIEQLPPLEREVIEQLWLEVYDLDRFGPAPRPGAPVAVVAERMGIARSVVRQIERVAFERLEKLLSE